MRGAKVDGLHRLYRAAVGVEPYGDPSKAASDRDAILVALTEPRGAEDVRPPLPVPMMTEAQRRVLFEPPEHDGDLPPLGPLARFVATSFVAVVVMAAWAFHAGVMP